MYQINFKSIFFKVFTLFLLILLGCMTGTKQINAMEIANHSYEYIFKSLPEKYQKEEYCYNSNGIALISFATYNGHDYKTSIKKKENVHEYVYCINYNRHIEFTDSYVLKQIW